MRNLADNGIIDVHAPLVDIKGSYVAQFEHVSFLIFSEMYPCTDLRARLSSCTVAGRKSSAAAMTTSWMEHGCGNFQRDDGTFNMAIALISPSRSGSRAH